MSHESHLKYECPAVPTLFSPECWCLLLLLLPLHSSSLSLSLALSLSLLDEEKRRLWSKWFMSSWGFGKGQFTEIIGILSTSPRSSSCWEVDLKLDVEVGILPIELCFASLCETFLNLSLCLSLSPGHRQGTLNPSWFFLFVGL